MRFCARMADVRPVRWGIGIAFALACIAAAPPTLTVQATRYGKQEIISGIWFTNFENSRFLKCSGSDCDNRPLPDWASIQCSPGSANGSTSRPEDSRE